MDGALSAHLYYLIKTTKVLYSNENESHILPSVLVCTLLCSKEQEAYNTMNGITQW